MYIDDESYCRIWLRDGMPLADLVPYLRTRGYSIVLSMRLLQKVTGQPLQATKELVAGHSAWSDVAKRMDKVHAKVIEIMRAEDERAEG